MKIELDEHTVKQLKGYFGRNDKTPFEHMMYEIFNDALKEDKKPDSELYFEIPDDFYTNQAKYFVNIELKEPRDENR